MRHPEMPTAFKTVCGDRHMSFVTPGGLSGWGPSSVSATVGRDKLLSHHRPDDASHVSYWVTWASKFAVQCTPSAAPRLTT